MEEKPTLSPVGRQHPSQHVAARWQARAACRQSHRHPECEQRVQLVQRPPGMGSPHGMGSPEGMGSPDGMGSPHGGSTSRSNGSSFGAHSANHGSGVHAHGSSSGGISDANFLPVTVVKGLHSKRLGGLSTWLALGWLTRRDRPRLLHRPPLRHPCALPRGGRLAHLLRLRCQRAHRNEPGGKHRTPPREHPCVSK